MEDEREPEPEAPPATEGVRETTPSDGVASAGPAPFELQADLPPEVLEAVKAQLSRLESQHTARTQKLEAHLARLEAAA